ncbi:hypothetical protein Nepgr_025951 [Nepenthes gracilis]|uniref:Uncharacterized protein n=1 Tax=Nepenthes gracilis TaxID=150966 RepID=A0AAD3T5Z0_NEPGR|nr:hypothetical protein Nepgr_025951 [Nepenthes gracilis]
MALLSSRKFNIVRLQKVRRLVVFCHHSIFQAHVTELGISPPAINGVHSTPWELDGWTVMKTGPAASRDGDDVGRVGRSIEALERQKPDLVGENGAIGKKSLCSTQDRRRSQTLSKLPVCSQWPSPPRARVSATMEIKLLREPQKVERNDDREAGSAPGTTLSSTG